MARYLRVVEDKGKSRSRGGKLQSHPIANPRVRESPLGDIQYQSEHPSNQSGDRRGNTYLGIGRLDDELPLRFP